MGILETYQLVYIVGHVTIYSPDCNTPFVFVDTLG